MTEHEAPSATRSTHPKGSYDADLHLEDAAGVSGEGLIDESGRD
jgi:hypothetical protein